MPITVSAPKKWRNLRKTLTGRLGFVPTMGHLHAGHLDLVARAQEENDHVLVSIFINPTQFNQASDYDSYARTLTEDCEKLDSVGADYVFAPDVEEIYPDDYDMQVIEKTLSQELEGAHRPGHFEGMLTVVLKLLMIAGAERAYFGEKDFQQLQLVRKMAQAFFLPVEIIGCATRREDDGLAMSSRNGRLTVEERQKAPMLFRMLSDESVSDEAIVKALTEAGFRPEYVAQKWGRRLAAAWLGDVRLIDNVPFGDSE